MYRIQRNAYAVGHHHIGESNPFNLTYDFIEPFRAVVDAWVFLYIRDSFTGGA